MKCENCVHSGVCKMEIAPNWDKENCAWSKPNVYVAPKTEWISVDGRLPEDNERVLCFSPSLVESNLGAVSVQFGWCCKRRNMDITHWMPLPKPPKGV